MTLSAAVVIPAHDAGPIIRESVGSALRPTHGEPTVIVVDHHPADDTATLARFVADERVRIVSADHRGVSAARDQSLAMISAVVVAVSDADDVWEPHKLETQLALLAAQPQTAAVDGCGTCLRTALAPPERAANRPKDGYGTSYIARAHQRFAAIGTDPTSLEASRRPETAPSPYTRRTP